MIGGVMSEETPIADREESVEWRAIWTQPITPPIKSILQRVAYVVGHDSNAGCD
jgi:hypothetical protein